MQSFISIFPFAIPVIFRVPRVLAQALSANACRVLPADRLFLLLLFLLLTTFFLTQSVTVCLGLHLFGPSRHDPYKCIVPSPLTQPGKGNEFIDNTV